MVRSKQNKQIREEVRALEQQVEQLSKVIEQLGIKSTEVMLSPGRVFIEQAVHVCETFLDTMVDEIRFKHKLHEAQQRNKCLNDQLIVYRPANC